ncbi:E3 ubiquitin-protein ligase PDZRN3-B-like, partial [Xenia sp. Carnegie-2017]|uniref:E3 ubiquitin-protein ligase PDZRN3-B-like n=1 Tax=Xenia sp. Carnegie-2017 TaxID=2897299 RepID=UPI001F03EB53
MARRPTHYKGGYEVRRFQTTVDNYFLCMICLKVVKDARMCHQTEHIFCRCCIEEHLRVNAQKCPQCQEKLSVATLLSARFVDNTISKLKIGCEFASRGCPEIITVQDLQSHVENCGFAPVLCSNERCGQVINKRDKIKHETELCEYRKIPSYDFIEIKEMFQQIVNHEAQAKMKMVELNAQMNQSFVGINGAIKETAEPSKTQFSRMQCEITESRKEIKDVRQNLSTVTEEMMES